MIKIKSPAEISIMKEGGKIASEALTSAISAVKPGVALSQLEKIAENVILMNGADSSFKKVDDYKYTTCINVNEGIVHGIPGPYKLREGDLVSIDLGAYLKGFHTDLSYTVEVGTDKEKKFLNAGRFALECAIKECRAGNRVGDISRAMQEVIEGAGYSVSRDLVGHGVGENLHEDPYVPCYGRKGDGPVLREGMVLAIEVIYQKGKPKLEIAEDGWTLKTADNSLSGLFEQTVAVTAEGPEIITPFSSLLTS
jgi:methionyl aminopeptidase